MTTMNYQTCIEACLSCAAACEHCASECLKEDDIKMLARCITLTRECAVLCTANAQLMAIGSENARMLCNECVTMCEDCNKECLEHAVMEHCRECAESCVRCAEACRNLMEVSIM